MRRAVSIVAIDAVALAVTAWLFHGIFITASTTQHRVLTLLAVAVIFGLINAVIAPVIKGLALPFIVLTLGVLLLVINALLLKLASWAAIQLGAGFHVHGFWTAVGGGLVVSILTWALSLAFDVDR